VIERPEALAVLRGTGFLRTLPEDDRAALLDSARQVSLRPGQVLCHEGEEGHAMFVLLAGHLVVSKSGKQIAIGSPGDCFGEMALIEVRERAATLRALDDAVVLEIPEISFRQHVAPNPESLMALLKVFAERARNDLEALAADNLELQAYSAEVERKNRELVEIRRQLEEKNRLLERLSAIDTLTQVANRRRFDVVLRQEWRRASRDAATLSLVFCDIDHFKPFNDTYGHQKGDEVLVSVAQAMEEAVNRPADLVARYGGEEFVALLVDTDAEGARLVAERMRERVIALGIEHRASTVASHLTVSLGVATVKPGGRLRAEDLVSRADAALYAAKQGGRNRVETAPVANGVPATPKDG
jgi:diguanylate cyclase (GGDEF)-like protein